MAIKFEKIEAGMTLLQVKREKMGNSTMSALSLFDVKIISVDRVMGSAIVSWNGNRPQTWYKYELVKLYTKPPKAYRDQEERRAKTGSWW